MKRRVIGLLLLLSIGVFAQPKLNTQTYTPKGRGYYIPTQIVQFQLGWYGEWVVLPSVGRVWVPSVWSNWQPYYYGIWVWTNAYGWVWYSYEPWGYITYHYGRWWWAPQYGWVWVPGNEWSPGWVIWIEGPSYIGWAPMGPRGTTAGMFSQNSGSRKLRPYVKKKNIRKPAWVIVNRQSFGMGNYQYLNPGVVKKQWKKYRGKMKPPTIKPTEKMKHYILKSAIQGNDVFKQKLNLRLKKVKHSKKKQKQIKGVLKGN